MIDSLHDFFQTLPARIDPARVAGIEAVFHFIAEGEGGGNWLVTVARGNAAVSEGNESETLDQVALTLRATTQDWLDILSGRLRGEAAFLTGRLKLQGDITLGMMLEHVLSV